MKYFLWGGIRNYGYFVNNDFVLTTEYSSLVEYDCIYKLIGLLKQHGISMYIYDTDGKCYGNCAKGVFYKSTPGNDPLVFKI